jgi:hypothetical protein
LKFVYEASTGKLKAKLLKRNIARIRTLDISTDDPHLRRWLGVHNSTVHVDIDAYTRFPRPLDIVHHVQFMDIRCDLTRDKSLGLYPILAWMTADDTDSAVLCKTIKKPLYCPVSADSTIQAITISLQNKQGNPLTFADSSAPTVIELSFKRLAY